MVLILGYISYLKIKTSGPVKIVPVIREGHNDDR